MNDRSSVHPYPGPRAFRREEKDCFFGRVAERRDLFSLAMGHRAVLLFASSGAGKTSLINAGLLPALEEASVDVFPPARVIAGTNPAQSVRVRNVFVFNAALHWLSDPIDTFRDATLGEVVARVPRSTGKPDEPRMLLFDQFEEIFTAHLDRWTDRQPFFDELAAALESDPLLHVILVLREDYLAQLEPFARLLPNRLRGRMRLERLNSDSALECITGPLAQTSRRFEDGVAESLVDDLLKVRVEVSPGQTVEVCGEFVEPVQLQVVCQSLWEGLGTDDDVIRTEHVRNIGSIDTILATFYDRAVEAAAEKTDVDELEIRNWFETELITTLGTRGSVYRGEERTGSLLNEIVRELEARHLVRAERRAGASWYELTHDRFIEPIRFSNRAHLQRNFRIEALLAYEHLARAQELWRRNRLDEAIEAAGEAVAFAQASDSGEVLGSAYYLSGALLVDAHRPEDALPALKAAADLSRESGKEEQLAGVFGLLGQALHDLQRFDEAIDASTRAIALMPNEPSLYERRGGSYWYSGRPREAIADFTRVLELDPTNANAYSARGQLYADLKRYHQAVDDLSNVIANAAHAKSPLVVAYALNGRGHAHGGLRQWEQSMADFSASLAIAPNNAWVYFNRAQVLQWKGEHKAALADLRTALEKRDPPLNPLKRSQAEAILAGRGSWPS